MDKAALRAQIREKKRAMRPEEVRQRSAALAERLFAHPAWKEAEAVYTYLSYNQEVCTEPIIRRALLEGKRIAAPRVIGNEIRFFLLTSLEDAAPGYRGIPEPIDAAVPADDLHALVLAPGLAFTKDGRRLGYGGGFYDRFFASEPEHFVLALCFDFQIVDSLPVEPHDRLVDAVVTEEV